MNANTTFEANMNYIEAEKQELLRVNTHCLVYGAAGSGKSTLLSARNAYLIMEKAVPAQHIWNLTFQHSLAIRMAKKFRSEYEMLSLPHMIDIYTLAYKLLAYDHEQKGTEMWSVIKNNRMFIQELSTQKLGYDLRKAKAEELQQAIGHCKSMLYSINDINNIHINGLDFSAFYQLYEKTRKAKQCYDLQDLINEALNLLSSDSTLLNKCHEIMRYIQIDDIQEISFAGHLMIKTLCNKDANLFATADLQQCIGKRQYAYPQALDSLQDTYPGMQIYFLTKDHRTAIASNKIANRFVQTHVEGVNENDGELKYKSFSTMERMYTYAWELIQKQPEQSHVFLYRNAIAALPLLDLLHQHDITSDCCEAITSLASQSIMQDMLCYIRLLRDPYDISAFFQIQEYLNLQIPKRALLEIEEKIKMERMDVYQALHDSSLRASSKKKLAAIMESIRLAKYKKTADMIDFILKDLAYGKILHTLGFSEKDVQLLVLYTFAERYKEPSDFIEHLEQLRTITFTEHSSIKILSIEESKGCEFENVYVLDCMDTLFPRTNAKDEYERALFYTAITRSYHHLELFTFKRVHHIKLDLSPFIFEIYEQKKEEHVVKVEPKQNITRITEMKRGKMIIHTTMGEGKIIKNVQGKLEVQFADGKKTLDAALCIQNHLIKMKS